MKNQPQYFINAYEPSDEGTHKSQTRLFSESEESDHFYDFDEPVHDDFYYEFLHKNKPELYVNEELLMNQTIKNGNKAHIDFSTKVLSMATMQVECHY